MELINNKINKLVPKIINDSGLYRKEIKKRIKLNNIFNEFENKASNELNFYLDESRSRYNKTKCGYNLDNLINNSRQKSVNHSMKILKDKFYFNSDIETERSKMQFKNSEKAYKILKDEINKIKFIPTEKNYETINKEHLKTPIKQNNLIMSPMNFSKKNLSKDKAAIKNFLTEENDSIHKSFDKYYGELNKMGELCDKEKKLYNREYIPENNKHKKLGINLPKIQLITYLKYKPLLRDPEEIEKLKRIDLYKILPYSKLGRFYNSIHKVYNDPNEKNSKSLPYITEPNCNDDKKYINNIHSTISVVADSANREMFMKNHFDKRRQEIENVLRMDSIPQVECYDEIAKIKSDQFKMERNARNKIISESQKYSLLTEKEKTNLEIDKNISLLNKYEKGLYGDKRENINNNSTNN